jgi:hypothetical protein
MSDSALENDSSDHAPPLFIYIRQEYFLLLLLLLLLLRLLRFP